MIEESFIVVEGLPELGMNFLRLVVIIELMGVNTAVELVLPDICMSFAVV